MIQPKKPQLYMTYVILVLCTVFLVRVIPANAETQKKSFAQWLKDFRIEAIAEGISPQTFDEAFEGVEPIEKVIEKDRNQPEFTMTLEDYLNRIVSKERIDKGKRKFRENRQLLNEISRKYNVQPRFLVALWGIETGFGWSYGSYPVIDSLATLAYDPRRSSFFRKQLLHALHILDKGYIAKEKMKGSWAGAMGGLQFMPSTFRWYAVDYNDDGRINMWQIHADLFASGANYLSKSGWNGGQRWGREVMLTSRFDRSLGGHKIKKSVNEWQALGVRKLNGDDLPDSEMIASVVIPDNSSRAFLAYHNYRVLLKWNRSDFFAIAVGLLADRIAGIR